MAAQTPVQTSLLKKILEYFELASTIGVAIPEPHVHAISTVVEMISADLLQNYGPQATAAPATPITVVPPVATQPTPPAPTPVVPPVAPPTAAPVQTPTTEEPPAWFQAWLATQQK